ncbi:MAG: family 10 glycosylhydrolase [Candidatus Caldatribacterium sp.]|uniref:family 10 glycosylhydrolase n=1 Tax=Candidatus Caldatribacterium sp. TaxID=2282143 RepID=UPI002998350F|nr:family 10 glycosylhydrolase [Candidatus Caldatribacterium sp.]MCX7730848.1 family 10 glycosylhydrolase [Candidatus Caldatribacterium sp.]MDW8081595.1 family 10 glycosylhydrolase [Candidatus Calescibacterium sp.]
MLFVLFSLFSMPLFCAAAPKGIQGVWIDVRSIPETPEGIRDLVARLYRAHCNALFVESFYRGETVYPSAFLAAQDLPPQMERFRATSIDPLALFIKEARKYGMQVHAWYDMFYVGLNDPGPILSRFPQWAAKNRDGTLGYVQGGKRFFFVCPMHEGVLAFYQGLLEEVARKYDLSGIHLDYFRFPDPTIADTCYCEDCRRAFQEAYGLDPLSLDPIRDFAAYEQWVAFRADALSRFAMSLAGTLRRACPEVLLSCAVKPLGFPLSGYPGFFQDWPRWGRERIFDFLVPMTYSSRPAEFEGLLIWVRTFLRETPFCAGVWCVGMEKGNVLLEVARAWEHTPCGVVLFAFPYLTEDLLTHVFSQPLEPPVRSDFPRLSALPLALQDILDRRRTIVARFVSSPVTVDGILEDAWRKADWQGDFVSILGEEAQGRTQVACLYDTHNLYVAYVLEGSFLLGQITAQDGPVFLEDSVELFLDPWFLRSFFMQFAVNALGTKYEASSFLGARFEGTWEVGVAINDGRAVVEIAIPFLTLAREMPKKGTTWGVNFCRNNVTSGEFSTWSPMPGVYGAPFFFGTLVFES